jgi:hypothetical protein
VIDAAYQTGARKIRKPNLNWRMSRIYRIGGLLIRSTGTGIGPLTKEYMTYVDVAE